MSVNASASRAWALVVLMLATALSACGQLPTSGPVSVGHTEAPAAGTVQLDATGPDAGDSPMEIVTGFIAAGAPGMYQDADFEIARSFLTDAASTSWSPLSDVVVFDNDALPSYRTRLTDQEAVESQTPTASGTGASQEEVDGAEHVTVDVQIVAVGDVDASGVFTPALSRAASEVAYTLVRVGGEWRIDKLPVGLMMNEVEFALVFKQVALQFLTLDGKSFVPDVRYVPGRNAASYAVEHLLNGPVEWLSPAVNTQVPVGLGVDTGRGGVTTDGGSVEVHLGQTSAPTQQLDLMYAQVRETLAALDISEFALWLGAAAYNPGTEATMPQAVQVPSTLVAVSAGDLVRIEGTELLPYLSASPEPSASASGSGEPTHDASPEPTGEVAVRALRSPAPAYDEASGVAALRGGELVHVAPDGTTAVLWEAANPMAPSQDRFGWIWTGEVGAPIAVRTDGTLTALDVSAFGDGAISQVRISADGARAVLLRQDVASQWLQVAAVVRDEFGTPTALVPGPNLVAFAGGSDVAWLDQATVALLGTSEAQGSPSVRVIPVGGPASTVAASSLAVSIATGDQAGDLYVGTSDGRLLVRVSLRWEEVATGVSDPAFAG